MQTAFQSLHVRPKPKPTATVDTRDAEAQMTPVFLHSRGPDNWSEARMRPDGEQRRPSGHRKLHP